MNVKVKKFELPDDVQLSDNEQKLMTSLTGWMAENFTDFAKGQKTEDELIKSIGDKFETMGFKEDTLKTLKDSLKTQGEALTKLKERANYAGPELKGFEKAFNENFKDFQTAVKNKQVGFEIKAIAETDNDMVVTTSNVITTTSGSFLPEIVGNDPNLYLKRRNRRFLGDIATRTIVDEVPEIFTFWEEGDENGEIAIIQENTLKPQVELGLIKNQVHAQKAAGFIVITEEVIKWRKRAWAAIQRLFRDKVVRDYENKLTTTLVTNASNYVGTPLDGTIANPTDFDAIIATILQGELLNFSYDTTVLNPTQKWQLAMTQTPNGMFILPYIQNGGEFGLLGLDVITSNDVPAGEFYIGESDTWFIEEENPTIRTALINDDARYNRMSVFGEIFFLSYIPSNNAGAWVHGNFANIKEALKTA